MIVGRKTVGAGRDVSGSPCRFEKSGLLANCNNGESNEMDMQQASESSQGRYDD
jgi:hypothetical protein